MPRVFISYSHADRPFVDRLADRLKASGVDVWIDRWEIQVGDSITAKVAEGIGDSDYLIAVLSCASVRSPWVRQELNAALIRNIEQEKHAFILPVLAEECEIPTLLRDRRYADFTGNTERAFRELLQVIRPEKALEPEMILIPAGVFLMGSDPEKDRDARGHEKPQHPLHLPDYSIARTPVTNAQYLAFVQAAGHKPPWYWEGGRPPEGKEDCPVDDVSWHDALAYCRWLAEVTGQPYSLPSEAEWEKAASWDAASERKRIYPWGDVWDASRCNVGGNTTTPVGRYSPDGDSPYGCADMAGNVCEWTRSLYDHYLYDSTDGREDLWAAGDRVVRGGSFYYGRVDARCAFRLGVDPDYDLGFAGFRVCVVA